MAPTDRPSHHARSSTASHLGPARRGDPVGGLGRLVERRRHLVADDRQVADRPARVAQTLRERAGRLLRLPSRPGEQQRGVVDSRADPYPADDPGDEEQVGDDLAGGAGRRGGVQPHGAIRPHQAWGLVAREWLWVGVLRGLRYRCGSREVRRRPMLLP